MIVPVGATEQHGPHLPLNTDALLATELALAVAAPLDLYVAPPLAYGYRSRPLSGGGPSFPGTISLGARTLMARLEDVLAGLIQSGFRRLAVLSRHFGNANFVYEAAWLAHERSRPATAKIMVVEAPFAELSEDAMHALLGDEFPGWDVEHAAVLETSLMLHLRPDLVRFDRAVEDAAERHPFYDVVPPPADFAPASGVPQRRLVLGLSVQVAPPTSDTSTRATWRSPPRNAWPRTSTGPAGNRVAAGRRQHARVRATRPSGMPPRGPLPVLGQQPVDDLLEVAVPRRRAVLSSIVAFGVPPPFDVNRWVSICLL